MGQGHGPGPGPMDRAIISEAANAADLKWGCGGAELPPPFERVQTFFQLSEQCWVTPAMGKMGQGVHLDVARKREGSDGSRGQMGQGVHLGVAPQRIGRSCAE